MHNKINKKFDDVYIRLDTCIYQHCTVGQNAIAISGSVHADAKLSPATTIEIAIAPIPQQSTQCKI